MELTKSFSKDEDTEADCDLTVETTETVWRGILAKDKSPAMAATKGELKVTPGLLSLQTFMSYLDTE